jgi:hypothetical protein
LAEKIVESEARAVANEPAEIVKASGTSEESARRLDEVKFDEHF